MIPTALARADTVVSESQTRLETPLARLVRPRGRPKAPPAPTWVAKPGICRWMGSLSFPIVTTL